MAIVKNVDKQQRPIPLSSGRSLGFGETENVDPAAPNEFAWIGLGSLIVVDGSEAPPVPAALLTAFKGFYGPWDGELSYAEGGITSHAGSAYLSIQPSVNKNPESHPDYWVDLFDASLLPQDASPETPSLRSLGTGASQASAGNDPRLSNARTPTAHAGTHATGGSDPISAASIGADPAGAAAAAQAAAEAASVPLAQKGAHGGVASLDGSGLLPTSQLPPLALTDPYVVHSEAEQLALGAHRGDFAIRTDTGKTYAQNGGTAGTMADWTEIPATGEVQSVNGHTGTVTLAASDVGAVPTSQRGASNGVGSLDGEGHQPLSELAPSVISGSGTVINVANAPYLAGPTKSAAENDVILLAAIEAAAGKIPVYLPEMIPVSLALTDQEFELVGPGGLIQQKGSSALTVRRTLGEPRSAEVSTMQFGANLAEAVQYLTVLDMSQADLHTDAIQQGDLLHLVSEDHYAAHYGNNEAAWTYKATWVPVLGLGLVTEAGEEFNEGDTIVGGSSGATATLLSVSPHIGGGQILVFGSFTGTFVAGEVLKVGGTSKGHVAALPFVVMDGKLIDTITTGAQVRKAGRAKCVIDTTVEASGNVDDPSVLEAERLAAIVLEGVIEPQVKGFARSAWNQFVQAKSCYGGDYDLRARKLPNNATAAVGAYGYVFAAWGATEHCTVNIRARNVRHGFTTNINENSTFAHALESGIYKMGAPKYIEVLGTVHNSISVAFDTHPGSLYIHFNGTRAVQTGSGNRSLSISPAYQNRGFGTSYSGAISDGCPVGFIDISQSWVSPIQAAVHYDSSCRAINYTSQGFLQGVSAPADSNSRYIVEGEAVGDPSINAANAYQTGFASYGGYWEGIGTRSRRFNGAPYYFKGSLQRVVAINPLADYTESSETSTGFRFDSTPAENPIVLDYKVLLKPGSPTALAGAIRQNSPTDLTVVTNGVQFVGGEPRPLAAVTGAGAFHSIAVNQVGGFGLPVAILTASNPTWPIPAGANFLEITAVGGGGGGGGGGSAATSATAQVGGSGGTSGVSQTQVKPVGENTTLEVTIGAGGEGGEGGAAGGHAGSNGSNGGVTKVVGTGISVAGGAGGKGVGSGATSTTVVKPVGYGGTGNAELQGNLASEGGSSGQAGGVGMGYSAQGGGGGGAANTEKGGGGGGAGVATERSGAAGASGASATTAGVNGLNGVPNTGSGGGGGGGGCGSTGAGGHGGSGSSGLVIIRVVG